MWLQIIFSRATLNTQSAIITAFQMQQSLVWMSDKMLWVISLGIWWKSWARTEMHLPWCFTKIQFATTTRLNEELTADLTLGTASSPICNVLSNLYSVFEQIFLLACWSVIRQTKQIMFYYLILWLSHTRVPERFLLSVRTKSKTENFVH